MNEFEKLGLGKGLVDTLKERGFSKPTEIQENTIPLVVKGKDVIGQAATGSGKTLAFGSTIIMNSKGGKGLQSLVMTPTRELAEQVSVELKKFSKHYDLKIVEIYGGVAFEPQVRRLERADVVVGTPGRILDHLERRTMNLGKVKILVLDEADRMVDMGFMPDVEKIINLCNEKRQTLLFSATISPDIDYVAAHYMNNPKTVTVKSYVDPAKLKQIYYDVADYEKFSLLAHLLKHDESHLSMVFCNTRGNVESLVRNLSEANLKVVGIHGGMSQQKRKNVMEDFNREHIKVLICTDVAARGLDIKNVSHVYNYDIPKDNTDYIHRIGRTARAGKEGEAISLVSSKDYMSLRKVLDDPSLKLEKKELPEFEKLRVNFSRREDRGFRGRGRGGQRYGAYSTGGPSRRGGYGGRSRDGSRGRGGDGRGRSGGYGNSGGRGRREGGDSRGRSYGNKSRSEGRGERGSHGGRRDSGRSYGRRSEDGRDSHSRGHDRRGGGRRDSGHRGSRGRDSRRSSHGRGRRQN